jgi:uncharacterized protein (DUF1330 family)
VRAGEGVDRRERISEGRDQRAARPKRAPYYEVGEINVTDQAGYEASGVVQLRDTIKASGAKLLAGGYNKATAYEGSAPANRYLIFVYPSKEVHDKVWTADIKPWVEKVKGKYVGEFRTIGVEAVEQK